MVVTTVCVCVCVRVWLLSMAFGASMLLVEGQNGTKPVESCFINSKKFNYQRLNLTRSDCAEQSCMSTHAASIYTSTYLRRKINFLQERNSTYKSTIFISSKVLPRRQGPWGGADLCFLSPQPDTSLHCETTDTGLVYRVVCPFTPQLSLVLTVPTHGGRARLS